MHDKDRENIVVGIILASNAPEDIKNDLLGYIRSRDGEREASFLLGQMDFRESVSLMLLEDIDTTKGMVRSVLRDVFERVQRMRVIH